MRLIDADAFIEYLGLDSENAREDNVGEIVTLEDFDRQPTAFDKEKVIEEMKNLGERFCTSVKCSGDCQNCDHGVMMRSIIEIVEKGGV